METLTRSELLTDSTAIRQQFPILNRMVKGKPLVYLDNAATTQKPLAVIDALTHYYSHYNANIHRGIHSLAEEATAAFEATRDTVKEFIGAAHREEIIFTKGATEGINLVAYTWARKNIKAGDEILVSGMEHHSNIVPWQIIAGENGARVVPIPVLDDGTMDMSAFQRLLTKKTKLVAVVHASNSLGTINPVNSIVAQAHAVGAKVLVDGAQSTVHLSFDVQDMDCDFFVFSGHKVYGPTGSGALYGKKELLETMPVFHGGGEMIKEVSFEGTTYNELPYKYEAGTPNIADTIALKFALDFVNEIGKETIHQYEQGLLNYATDALEQIKGLKIIGKAPEKTSVISFIVDGVHPQDLGILLDNKGIAVRTGHHCTQPLMDRFGIPGTTRASFAMYTSYAEIDALTEGLERSIKTLL
ncbi:cysteine desulfurase [Flavihumibacter sp. UBA7668]|uniref:cysteine desulfurase n=1 Tax=Flavihumibacter sp. UBA7668 TaxID=1946542 RepID=UPI0025B9DAE8|nr:cysteine desulfurase [Flavihumibacter sp. UBA7668]